MQTDLAPKSDRTLGVRRSIACLIAIILLSGCGSDQQRRTAEQLRKKMASVNTAVEHKNASKQSFATQWRGGRTLSVAEGVHVLGELSPSAVYAIQSSAGVILIDAGVDEDAVGLRNSLLRVGIAVEEVRYVLLTHAHYDHVFGANRVRQVAGATVCAGADDCDVLRSADETALFSLFPRVAYSGDPIQVDQALHDGDVIVCGDVTVTAMACPGHTPGSMAYLVEKDAQRYLFSGDVIASLNFGPATYPASLAPRFRGDANAYLQTINRLLDIEPPDLLLTGHPLQQTRAQSSKLDATEWKQLLEPAKSELQELIARHQKDGADFLDGNAKQIEESLYYFGELDDIAIYGFIQSDQFTLFNAPGGERLAPFLLTRLAELNLPRREPDRVLLTSTAPEFYSGLTSFSQPRKVVIEELAAHLIPQSLSQLVADVKEMETSDTKEINTMMVVDCGFVAFVYSFRLNSKLIMLSPSVPRKLSMRWVNRLSGSAKRSYLQPQTSEFSEMLSRSAANKADYQQALNAIEHLSPDIWLPALTVNGQNANLYLGQWAEIIESNREIATGL